MSTLDLQPLLATGKQLTASTAAWLLAVFQNEKYWDASMRESFVSGVQAACEQAADVQGKAPVSGRQDPRLETIIESQAKDKDVLLVYTDYEFASHVELQDAHVRFTDDRASADFLLLAAQVKNFLALPVNQRVGQFPYEGAIVRKDLLPLTVRKYCYKDGKAPAWWHPYFDLRTEFHLFVSEHRRRHQLQLQNRWIIKPAQGTRALGHQIIADPGVDGLHHAAVATPLLPGEVLQAMTGAKDEKQLHSVIGTSHDLTPFDGSDRIAQLFVERPLLIGNRKFDMRYFVFVRSFYPLQAYAHELRYGRLANKPYSIDALNDNQVALTVCAYDEDERIANMQERAFHTDLERLMAEQYGEGRIDVSGMHDRTITMLRELFAGAGMEIGTWPNSSAYYAVDLIYEGPPADLQSVFTPQPKLLEVNFMGDWHGVEAAVGTDMRLYYEWATDLFLTLGHPDENKLPMSRLIKL